MKNLDLEEIKERALKIRKQYHQLEKKHHGTEWTVEEDALAFLTDAGLVGRYTMSQQGRWPKENTNPELKHKLAPTARICNPCPFQLSNPTSPQTNKKQLLKVSLYARKQIQHPHLSN